MAGRHEQHEAVGAQADGVQARVGDRFGHHRDVGLVAQQALEHDRGIVDRQGEGEGAGTLLQGGHDRHDMVRGIGGDPQMTARQGLLALEQGLRLFLDGEQAAGDALELAAGLGRHDGTAAPVEQADAVGLFQRRDLARKVGLAQPRIAGRGGEGARFGDEVEGAELAGRHIN